MTCVVTGACGYIGTVLVRALYEKGYEVISLAMAGEDAGHVAPYSQVVCADVCDLASLQRAFAGADMVVHLAGVIDIGSRHKAVMRRVNVEGTRNAILACQAAGVKRLVYCSSVHAIPEKPGDELMSEACQFDPDKVRGDYAKTKARATQLVLAAAGDGLEAVVVMPSGVIGPYEYRTSNLGAMIVDYLCGALTAFPKRGRYNFVDVRDVAKGIVAALENGASGECYILAGQVITVEQMLRQVAKTSGRKMLRTALPPGFLLATSRLAEAYYFLRRQKPLFTHYSIETLLSNCNFSNQKARQQLGLTFRPAEASLSDMTQWIMAHHVEKHGERYRRARYH